MGDDRRAAQNDAAQEEYDLENELDLDAESTEDLEGAMQEALEAVEKKASRTIPKKGDSGDEIRPPAVSKPEPDRVGDSGRFEEEIAELKDRTARTLADFENFRRRVDREKKEDRQYAAFDILREFLAVVDNLERALASEGSTDDMKVGVELIHRQMNDLMKNSGVERISSVGEEFDPRFHEAVTHHEDSSISAPTVSEELQAGYLMYDRLLRPSVVKVAMPPEGNGKGDPDA